MNTYVVGYELQDAGDARRLGEHLEAYDVSQRCLGSMWIIKTRSPLNQIKINCRAFLSDGDKLLICKYQSGVDIAMWSGFEGEAEQWLQRNL